MLSFLTTLVQLAFIHAKVFNNTCLPLSLPLYLSIQNNTGEKFKCMMCPLRSARF
jgi:hypothetical protein